MMWIRSIFIQEVHICRSSLDVYQYEIILVILLDFSLTVKGATLIFISGRGSAIPSAK